MASIIIPSSSSSSTSSVLYSHNSNNNNNKQSPRRINTHQSRSSLLPEVQIRSSIVAKSWNGSVIGRSSRRRRSFRCSAVDSSVLPSALLFDCDGVLVDTEKDGHRVSFNDTFTEKELGVTWDVDLYGELCKTGFTVAAVKKWMRGTVSSAVRFGFRWSKWVPNKCNIFMWRAYLDRLPTKRALMRRNIPVENHLCVWCGSNEETIEHILTGCVISAGIWNGITRWCRIPGMIVFHVNDLVEMHEHCGVMENKKVVLHGIIIIACRRMWRARNEKVFLNKEPNVVEMIADIKTLGFLWYKHRFKQGVVDWERWCTFELM